MKKKILLNLLCSNKQLKFHSCPLIIVGLWQLINQLNTNLHISSSKMGLCFQLSCQLNFSCKFPQNWVIHSTIIFTNIIFTHLIWPIHFRQPSLNSFMNNFSIFFLFMVEFYFRIVNFIIFCSAYQLEQKFLLFLFRTYGSMLLSGLY